MTLGEYLTLTLSTMSEMSEATRFAYKKAVERFCTWRGSDIDMDVFSMALVDNFEATAKVPSCRKLASCLRMLGRLYDPDAFPQRVRYKPPGPGSPRYRTKPKYEPPHGKANTKTFSGFAAYYTMSRDVGLEHGRTLARRAAMLEAFAGATAIAEVLTEENVNGFLASLDVAPYTVNGYRGSLLSLWNAAADRDLVEYPLPRRIWKKRLPALVIECYSQAEVEAMIATAGKLTRRLPDGRIRRHYWPAIIQFAWDTGLRRADCWAFERASVRPDRTFAVVQKKTGFVVRRALRPATIAAIDRLGGPRPLEWTMNQWSFGLQFKRITELAGVAKGTFKWLRRSTGSHVDAEHPGAGSKALGHQTAQIFDKHYNARLAGDVYMPPELSVG